MSNEKKGKFQKVKEPKAPKEKKPMKGWKKGLLIALAVLLVLIVVCAVAVYFYAESLLNNLNRKDPHEETTLSTEQVNEILGNNEIVIDNTEGLEADTNLISEGDDIIGGPDFINIMLIGVDYPANLSDTMMLATINVPQRKLVLTSFLRDMYVKLPNYNGMVCGSYRMNVNYALGGMGMVDQCVYEQFGLEVDHNVVVIFDDFAEIAEILGGVDMELTKREANWLNNLGYGWSLQEGMNHLNGEQTFQYARIRKIDSDFARTERQRKVIMAFIDKMRDMSVTEIDSILRQVLPYVLTDMENSDIYSYLTTALKILPELTYESINIPAENYFYSKNIGTEEEPQYVLVPDLVKNREYIYDKIGLTTEEE